MSPPPMTPAEEAALAELVAYFEAKPETNADLSAMYGRSREWARRIEMRALDKLRRITRCSRFSTWDAPESVEPWDWQRSHDHQRGGRRR